MVQPLLILSPFIGDPPGRQGFIANLPIFEPPRMQAWLLLILPPFIGDPSGRQGLGSQF